ncbi:MAG: DUF5655 domain-containing protein [candidate division Zixibacteria bacterium]|nr:DUF5655 domain-containing protein [candidate division Zixibacteria bacterium]
MNKLIQTIEQIRQKIPSLHRHSIKETSTRTIVIDPLLEALGWSVRDPDEVQLEYPTVDGKFVDYALKLNKKVVLLVEAKSLGDPLSDMKAITQVVAYSANDGIEWCILTNGIKWKVYRSIEKCPAPDKLMYEVNLESIENEGITVQQIANQMWRFSSEEMAKGTLDTLGEQTFTDGKIRKALQTIMSDSPRTLLNLLKKTVNDDSLSPQQIKNSLTRIAGEATLIETPVSSVNTELSTSDNKFRNEAAYKTGEMRKAKKGESPSNENNHTSGKPQETIQLYQAIDRFCLGLSSGEIKKRFLKKTINYEKKYHCFCSIHLLGSSIRIWLRLKFGNLEQPPAFARDVSGIGHWGAGDLELRITTLNELNESLPLIQRSFESVK